MRKVVVAGAGAFGTAMAVRLAANPDNAVTIHTIIPEVADEINASHTNARYVPSVTLPESISATTEDAVFSEAQAVFLAIPAKHIVSFAQGIRPFVEGEPLVVNLAKGMSARGAFITQDIPFSRSASLKGPSFAAEVVRGLPTALTFGGARRDYAFLKDDVLAGTGFELDYCADVRAVELCSVLKNIYAIAVGIATGRYDSKNIDFMVLSMAAREMRAILKLYSCDEEALYCYCGLGDLGLTALTDLSRNRTYGFLLGKGFTLDPGANGEMTVEGHRNADVLHAEITALGVESDFKLLSALYSFLYENSNLEAFLKRILPKAAKTRP